LSCLSIHYEWRDGKRIFAKHALGTTGNSMEINGNRLGPEKREINILKEIVPPKVFGTLELPFPPLLLLD